MHSRLDYVHAFIRSVCCFQDCKCSFLSLNTFCSGKSMFFCTSLFHIFLGIMHGEAKIPTAETSNKLNHYVCFL